MDAVLQTMFTIASPFNFFFNLGRATIVCVEITIILGCLAAWVFLVTRAVRAMKGRKERG